MIVNFMLLALAGKCIGPLLEQLLLLGGSFGLLGCRGGNGRSCGGSFAKIRYFLLETFVLGLERLYLTGQLLCVEARCGARPSSTGGSLGSSSSSSSGFV